jgi:hypothetical protein
MGMVASLASYRLLMTDAMPKRLQVIQPVRRNGGWLSP